MRRALAALSAVAVLAALLAAASVLPGPDAPQRGSAQDAESGHKGTAHITTAVKSSRPGCGECYIPAVFEARAGAPVVWRNGDAAFHSVTSGEYHNRTDLFDSGYMDPGDTFEYTFLEPGRYQYYCTLHEWMTGTILVR